MLDDVLHSQCVQDMEDDQVMAVVVEDDQVMAVVVEDDQVMAVDIAETDLLEINTKEEVVHVQHTEDKTAIPTRNGNLTLKDKD
jgi:hypothetical protein